MKTLYLIRHAKAGWDNATLSDFERPLTEVGQNHAHTMAKKLLGQGVKPDLIITSPALRALSTAQIMAEVLGYPQDKIITQEAIFTGGVEELVEIIKGIQPANKNVLLFGHNPNLTWLLHYLCEGAKMNIPTCGIVALAFEMQNWEQLSDVDGRLLTFMRPPHEPEHAL